MPDSPVLTTCVARIIGTLDATHLVRVDRMTNQEKIQVASAEAMRTLLNTDLLDFYLLSDSSGLSNSVRWYNVPFGTDGVIINPTVNAGITTAKVTVWIVNDRPHVSRMLERPQGFPGLSSVIPALYFRRVFGTGERRLDLGAEFGHILFTPTAIEVGWRPDVHSGAGTPWYRFDYTQEISNYVNISNYAEFGVWLWFTNIDTGEPEQDWHKVSHVVRQVEDAPSVRIDAPREPPSRQPSLLRI